MTKKLYIKTYGCQMNEYDSLKMHDLLTDYINTDSMDDADMIILNTCHIREKASEKIYSELGRIKKIKDAKIKSGNKIIIAVAGCVGQAEGDLIFSRAPYVDIVVGPQSYHELPNLLSKIANNEKHLINLDFIEEDKFDKLPIETNNIGVSSFISVQEGCNKFCTFCVVPYTRGSEFSRNLEQIYREVLSAVSKGAKELILLGQNVNAYHGKNFDGHEASLADLIKYLAKIDNLERIRYITSHPIDMSDDLIDLHGLEPKLMEYLHLPIQSGSDKLLKAMNRKHDREYYFNIIARLRKSCPQIAFSSDFIIGFPGETDEDFADTLDLIDKVRYDAQCFSFKYSPRPGTPAALKEQVPEVVKAERLKILQQKLANQYFAFNESCVGKTMKILFDREGKLEDQIAGKSPYMQSVHVQNNGADVRGKIVDVRITKALANSLIGELIAK
jgi:tRNA-2-methylthio-N6-dimethylallyladenosine synthase